MQLATTLAPATPAADLDQLGDEIAELSAHLDAATARLLTLIREFDARGGWANGARSCAEWLSWRVGLDLGAARERVRVARALGALPQLAAALERGELSYSKVRALTRVATPETEARLLAVGRAGTAAHVERIVRGWRRVDRQVEGQEATARHRGRSLQVYPDEDGMLVVRGRLTPTRLDNLALLCRLHHGAVHEEGYQVERDVDGTLHFRTPNGRPIPEVPAPPAVPADPIWALVTANRARGLAIGARTGCPSWGGERLDLGWAIDVLHPAANPLASRPML